MKMDPKFRKALEHVVLYLWHDERLNYQGERDHIFRPVALLEAYLTESQPNKTTARQKESLQAALD
jgi:hypothetical protein